MHRPIFLPYSEHGFLHTSTQTWTYRPTRRQTETHTLAIGLCYSVSAIAIQFLKFSLKYRIIMCLFLRQWWETGSEPVTRPSTLEPQLTKRIVLRNKMSAEACHFLCRCFFLYCSLVPTLFQETAPHSFLSMNVKRHWNQIFFQDPKWESLATWRAAPGYEGRM